MATIRSKTTCARRQSANLPSPSLFTGSYDDASFSHTSPQLTKPIHMPQSSPSSSSSSSSSHSSSSRPAFFSCYANYLESSAVLDDSDAHSEDELPPSPSRRHSGAMSISHEDLSSCYDREALRRETAAHQRRAAAAQQAFAEHAQWDCEVDGPHMALWTPDAASSSAATTTSGTAAAEKAASRRTQQHQVSYIEGPMMCLWEP